MDSNINLRNMNICSARFVLAILVASGVMVIYISRVSLSVAIVAMVRTVKSTEEVLTPKIAFCTTLGNEIDSMNVTYQVSYLFQNSNKKKSHSDTLFQTEFLRIS